MLAVMVKEWESIVGYHGDGGPTRLACALEGRYAVVY